MKTYGRKGRAYELREWHFDEQGNLYGKIYDHSMLEDGTEHKVSKSLISYMTEFKDGETLIGTFTGGDKYWLSSSTKRI